MCPSMRVFACGFNTRVLHRITVVKCVGGCPKIILDAGMVGRGHEAPVSCPACSPDLESSRFYVVEIYENQSLPVQSVLERNFGVEFSSVRVK
jgi:hypothetical protein